MSDSKLYCTFHLGPYLFGIEVLRVQEVLRYQEMTRVPLAPPMVRGLINLRGQIVPAIDMRQRLHQVPWEEGAEPMNVVVRTDSGAPVSLLVDEIGDVLDADDSLFEPAPEMLDGADREAISGAYKLPNRLMLVLNTDAAIDVSRV